MSNTNFDPVAYKSNQRRIWNGLAAGWASWSDAFEAAAGPVTAKLIELAAIAPGHSVLDVATGTGEPALSVAAAVGASGRVVGVDQSAEMVAFARQRAAGLEHVTFQESDAEEISFENGSFDAIVSRWGLMFLPDRAKVLRSLHDMLRDGGTLAAAVWDIPPKVPMIALTFGIIGKELSLSPPPPGEPNPFNMTDKQAVEQQLRDAGFTDVAFEDVPVTFTTESVAQAKEYFYDMLPSCTKADVRKHYGTDDAPEIWDLVASALKGFSDESGKVTMTSTCICFKAKKPA